MLRRERTESRLASKQLLVGRESLLLARTYRLGLVGVPQETSFEWWWPYSHTRDQRRRVEGKGSYRQLGIASTVR